MNFKNEKNFIFLSLGIVLIFFLSVTYFFQTEISSQKKVSDQEPSVKRLRFAGVGDNLIHDSIYNAADRRKGVFGDGQYDFDHLYENIKPELDQYDLKYINQESIIAGDKFGISTYPKFNTPQAMIPTLTRAGFNMVNMANNHSLDKGSWAIPESIKLWDQTDVYHTGVFSSQEDRDRPLIIDKKGIKVGFLSYTYGTNGMFPDTDYRVSYLNEDKIRKDIANIKDKVDFILVSCHWGEEGIQALDNTQKKYSKLFNDLGVDVVLGTHAHKIQTVKWLENQDKKKTLVYYGTGNFVHNMLTPITYLEGMATFDFVKDGDKKYIDKARFVPLVFHLERNQYGLDGSVYRLDKYPIDLANRHIEMYGNGAYHLENYRNIVKSIIPQEFLENK